MKNVEMFNLDKTNYWKTLIAVFKYWRDSYEEDGLCSVECAGGS